MLKNVSKIFSPLALMYRKNLVPLFNRALSPTYTIFTTVHCISDMKNIHKFHGIRRISTRVRACTDERTYRQIPCIYFNIFLKMLIVLKKRTIQLKPLLQ